MSGKSRNLIRCVLLTATVGALAAMPGVGFANSRIHADPSGDVTRLDWTNAGPVVADAPGITWADIVHVKVAHTLKRVSVRLQLSDLRPRDWSFIAKIETSGQKYQVLVTPRSMKFRVGPGLLGFDCAGKSASRNYEKGLVKLHIPRTCLGNPRWIRLAMNFSAWRPKDRKLGNAYGDQAFATGAAWTDRGSPVYTYSRRLRP